MILSLDEKLLRDLLPCHVRAFSLLPGQSSEPGFPVQLVASAHFMRPRLSRVAVGLAVTILAVVSIAANTKSVEAVFLTKAVTDESGPPEGKMR
jgi:hypothetical protein